jgi:hypothetical protein
VADPLSGTPRSGVLTVETRFAELGLALPEIPPFPDGQEPKLEPIVVHGTTAYLSGIGPIGTTGVCGGDVDVEAGYEAARQTALLSFRRIVDAFGTLDAVARWIKVLGFVRSAPDFAMQPAVLNGFSDLVIDVYGAERGRCARSAIGVSELPMNIPVEVEAILLLDERLVSGPD